MDGIFLDAMKMKDTKKTMLVAFFVVLDDVFDELSEPLLPLANMLVSVLNSLFSIETITLLLSTTDRPVSVLPKIW